MKVLPASALALIPDGGVPLNETIASMLNLFVTGGLMLIVPVVLALMHPISEAAEPLSLRTAESAGDDVRINAEEDGDQASGLHALLEHTPVLPWVLAIALGGGVWRYAQMDGLANVGLNEINAVMLALALVMHGSIKSFVDAVEEGAKACSGVIVQFPLYAGIMAMLGASGLIAAWSELVAGAGGPRLTPLLTFLSAGVVNLFVPSGGGQWGIQGPIALESGYAAGVQPGRMVMAVAYGDQLTNMLQPFWALPLLAITGVKAREIVGYTVVVMVIAGAWITAGLLLM
jgi:short-chain fatty acids transporter